MNEKIKLIAVDDNIELVNIIEEFISTEKDITLVGTAKDGLEAIDCILEHKPNVVLLDIILPKLDGIGVLEKLSKEKFDKPPIFIMFSALGQDVFVQKALSLGAEYYVVKPFDVEVLFSRVRQIYKEQKSKQNKNYRYDSLKDNDNSVGTNGKQVSALEIKICGLLNDLEILPNMAGYRYLREIVKYIIVEGKQFSTLTKELYPAVAEICNTTPRKVERSIRTCIDKAWLVISEDAIDKLFGHSINYSKERPTNSEFIGMITERIKMLM